MRPCTIWSCVSNASRNTKGSRRWSWQASSFNGTSVGPEAVFVAIVYLWEGQNVYCAQGTEAGSRTNRRLKGFMKPQVQKPAASYGQFNPNLSMQSIIMFSVDTFHQTPSSPSQRGLVSSLKERRALFLAHLPYGITLLTQGTALRLFFQHFEHKHVK